MSPNAGLRSSSHMADSSYSAYIGRLTHSGLRPCRNRSDMTFLPSIVGVPSIMTLPGVADMLGPRTVRPRPLTCR